MRDHRSIRRVISRMISGYQNIGEVDDTKREFQIDGRTFHEPPFNTTTGKARFHVIGIPEVRQLPDNDLRLMTVRSEGQFNTVVYEDEDLYRGQERRDVILMNVQDVRRMRLSVDQPVTVRSESGEMSGIIVRTVDIPPGNAAMYYPEANVLVPRMSDTKSGTPAFKNIDISIFS
jgi:anaerobic selenocysteine-containing dehydrogenase